MRTRLTHRPTQALIAAAVLLAVVIAVQVALPAASVDLPSADDGSVDDSLPDFGSTRFEPPSMAELSEMLDRPLFFPDRRLPQVAAPAEAPRTPLRLRLEGIAIMADSRVAVLRATANNQLGQRAFRPRPGGHGAAPGDGQQPAPLAPAPMTRPVHWYSPWLYVVSARTTRPASGFWSRSAYTGVENLRNPTG